MPYWLGWIAIAGASFGMAWIIRGFFFRADLRELTFFRSVKTLTWEETSAWLQNFPERNSQHYFTMLHGYAIASEVYQLKYLAQKLSEHLVARYGRLLNSVIKSWDTLAFQELGKAEGIENSLQSLVHMRRPSDVFLNSIEMIGNVSNYEDLVRSMNFLLELEPGNALDVRTSPEFTYLCMRAIEKVPGLEYMEALGRLALPTTDYGIKELYFTQLAELENRSDELCNILTIMPVGSKAWKIAFDKLKAMDRPELETSGTYGAP